ncbi:MAG: hypothetical protein L0177_03205, partial [Chloroflexi bacterium]|nr:hypothetical protein [Chloroflexota bacterium]
MAIADTADESYARGLKLYLSGEYAQAAVELQYALQEDPQHVQAQELLQLLDGGVVLALGELHQPLCPLGPLH